MKVVVDTNVIISGVFFGGAPAEVLKAIVSNRITACASKEIIEESWSFIMFIQNI